MSGASEGRPQAGGIREILAVLALFAAMTILQLLPLSLRPLDMVHDPGDPLLNTWILSWVDDQLVRNPFRIFEANIFFPHHLTLAFSEHMLPLGVVSAPFYFLSKDPVLSYNFIFFMTFLLNAAGMYALVKHLTRNGWAGIVAGLIFTFGSYKIIHVSHLQLLASMGIPWAFLYLHKYLSARTWRNALLFSLFFTLQGLSCIYYGLFFIAVLALILPVFLLLGAREIRPSFFFRLAVSLALGCGILILFSLPYVHVFRTMGFERALPAGAEVQNYLAADPTNLLLGRVLNRLGTYEKFLFPGVSAIFLAIVAVVSKKGKFGPRAGRKRTASLSAKVARIAAIAFVAANLLSVIAALAGGVNFKLGPLRLSASRPEKPVLYLFLFCGLYLLVKVAARLKDRIRYRSVPFLSDERAWILGYSVLTFWAALLSFGPAFTFMGRSSSLVPMPFSFFYRSVMGFNGIREPARFAVFVLFGTGVLAGYGFHRIARAIRNDRLRIAAAAVLIAFFAVESASIPIDHVILPTAKDVPPTYAWLRTQAPGAVVLELPFSEWLPGESLYLYFSTFHKKRLINGYSGFLPASTYALRAMFREFPGAECLDLLAALKVDFLIFHAKMIPEDFVPAVAAHIESTSGGALRLARRFQYSFPRMNTYDSFLGDDLVFRVRIENSGQPGKERAEPVPLAPISPAGWQITVSGNPSMAARLTDNYLATEWNSGEALQTGEFIQVDLGEPRDIAEITLQAGSSFYEFGRDFRVEYSGDGRVWRVVPARYLKADFCLALIEDQVHAAQTIRVF